MNNKDDDKDTKKVYKFNKDMDNIFDSIDLLEQIAKHVISKNCKKNVVELEKLNKKLNIIVETVSKLDTQE